jgi:hypothetical protein
MPITTRKSLSYVIRAESLTQDPTVVRLRAAAAALHGDTWIAARHLRGEDEIDDDGAISRWSTVVAHPDELGWLREALHHRDEPEDPDDELEPL